MSSIGNVMDIMKECDVVVYYQPILDNETKLLHKYESLMRLNHNGKILEPSCFLQHSKEIGCYNALSKKMLVMIFEELRKFKTLNVSINISMLNIVDIKYCVLLFSELDKTSNLKRVTLEFTELDQIDFERAFLFFAELKKRGVKISLDDFGSGYANYEYLLSRDFDYLKIDGNIIKKICCDRKNEAIVESILNYSKEFRIPIIAEHVETLEIYNKVCDMGIEYSQGYYIGRPSSSLLTKLEK